MIKYLTQCLGEQDSLAGIRLPAAISFDFSTESKWISQEKLNRHFADYSPAATRDLSKDTPTRKNHHSV